MSKLAINEHKNVSAPEQFRFQVSKTYDDILIQGCGERNARFTVHLDLDWYGVNPQITVWCDREGDCVLSGRLIVYCGQVVGLKRDTVEDNCPRQHVGIAYTLGMLRHVLRLMDDHLSWREVFLPGRQHSGKLRFGKTRR